jgi:hypothetical protein
MFAGDFANGIKRGCNLLLLASERRCDGGGFFPTVT